MMASDDNPAGRSTRFMAGLAEDIWQIRSSRKIANEIAILAERLFLGEADRGKIKETEPFLSILSSTKSILLEALESRSASGSTFSLQWGSPNASGASAEATAEEPVSRDKTGSNEQNSPSACIPAQEAGGTTGDKAEVCASPEVIRAVIDLADWAQKVSEDERISPERAGQISRRKVDSLITVAGIERIERTGKFDEEDQEIVDSVAADSPSEDLFVASTIESGYRAGKVLVRPQRVMVYRYALDPSVAESASADAINQ